VKTINDSVRLKGLILILLVFGVYIRISIKDLPAVTIRQRKQVINKAIVELKRLREQRQVSNALDIRNRPNIDTVLLLLLNSEVIIYRENVG